MSSGQTIALITERPIRAEELVDFVSAPGHGATAVFVGTIRNAHEGRAVKSVMFDSFRPLAEKRLGEIASEAATKWRARVAVAHRLGRLEVGQVSIGIAAGTAHRAEAFEACRFVIEAVKSKLPVWKQEHYADGRASWLEGCELAPR